MKITKAKRSHTCIPENSEELIRLRNGKWEHYFEEKKETIYFRQKKHQIRSGLTFTPYANPTKCNAHCRFCSEELQRQHQSNMTATRLIDDYDQYFRALSEMLNDLAPAKHIGLSLSGLEATSDPAWLLRLLEVLAASKVTFDEKVLYTNATGLCTHPALIDALQKAAISRIEVSRCHYDEVVNQKIMYFNRNEPVYRNEAYENLIKKVLNKLEVKNSCMLTQIGINSVEEIEHYLAWAASLGIKTVVFRELSRLDETYLNNNTKLWVEKNRVRIDGLLSKIMGNLEQQRPGWQYRFSQSGYYYYSEHFSYKNSVNVALETSSYNELLSRNKSGIAQKLVFHSNGNLCGDWNPDNEVIANYYGSSAQSY